MSNPTPSTHRWNCGTRVAFRFAFIYLGLYALANGNVSIFSLIPVVGVAIQRWLNWPGVTLAQALGRHWFHLTGTAATWHGTGSGDTALNYIRILCFAMAAALGTIGWSVLDRDRPHYQTLMAWLRFLLRLCLGFSMLVYGFSKVFPLQMRAPGLAILNNTYGNSSPMTLLWTMIGLHPGYEVVCGAAEVAAGMLLLFRRTATAGALLTLVVMGNVVLYNFFFDVPVKIFSAHMEIFALFTLLPDFGAFWAFFVRGQPAQLTGVWVPPASRRRFRIATVIVEYIFLAGVSVCMLIFTGITWRNHELALAPAPIVGAWQVDAIVSPDPNAKPVSPEGNPWAVLYIEDQRSGFYRSSDGALWRCGFGYDAGKHQLKIFAMGLGGSPFAWKLTDPDHLVLSRFTKAKQPVTLSLHRLPTPKSYPLLDRRFNWVNEWGYER